MRSVLRLCALLIIRACDRRRKRVLSVPAEEDTIAPALAAQQREKLNEPTESSPAM